MLRNDKMVGLFFIIGNELITESEHFTKGKQEGVIYRYSKTHKEVWDELYKGKYKVEYDFYPRGEVIYELCSDSYIVYKDPCIDNSYIDKCIAFTIKSKYTIISDERFLCHACRTNSNIFGAICGDVLGSTFEFEKKKYNNISEIDLFRDGSHFTDDTVLTLAVADWLLHDLNDYEDDDYFKDKLVKRMVDYVCRKYKNQPLGYGFSFWQWCNKAYLIDEYEPYNSFGNGSAMRVSPVGWFFDTMEETMRFAKLSADITHNHPEGEKGAMCIAAAIFLARNGKSKDEIKEYIIREFGYSGLDFSVEVLREKSNYSVTCQDTVPLAVAAFLESTDFESAIKLAISYGSDSDTIAAMSGSIAEAYYKEIPLYIANFCKCKLDKHAACLCKEFFDFVNKQSQKNI